MTTRAVSWAAAVGALLLLGTACSGSSGSVGSRPLDGRRIEVMATWSGTEQQRFVKVLDAFAQRTGVVVAYTSAGHRLPEVLVDRLAAGAPPDVALLPQPGLLADLARDGRLRPLDAETARLVREHFSARFVHLGSYGSRLYGVWFKGANKSLVWYDVAAFERAGVVPPHDLAGLGALADRLAADGVPAFAVAGRDRWTLTDWFENLYLRLAGGAAYDALAAHRTPWTSADVVATLQAMAALLSPPHVAGGVVTALRTGFEQSVAQVFAQPARAAMVVEGDFVEGVITGTTTALPGTDADVFAFPAGPDRAPGVVGGGDAAVLLRASPAATELIRFLATPDAAAVWAAAGGFVSPNLDLDLQVYPDDASRRAARQLLEAGDDFHFDLSDLQPASFGGSNDSGMRAALATFLVQGDPVATAQQLEDAATASYAAAGSGSS